MRSKYSSAAGAVADPKGALTAAKKNSRRIAPWAIVVMVMAAILVFMIRRRR